MKYPKIYLVLDNCFAIKRWIKPSEWFSITQDLGFGYAQASTDNEIDPLFCPDDYLDDWFSEVKNLELKTGIKVVNFYTGYQTYRTAGLAHHDERIRKRLMEDWLKKMILRVADLKAKGLGFSLFAIPHSVLQNSGEYKEMINMLCSQMADAAEFAHRHGKVQLSYEQMYAPHQPPFTIKGTREFIAATYAIKKKPTYVTIDLGHMTGQYKFLMPSRDKLMEAIRLNTPLWLGSDEAFRMFEEAVSCSDTAKKNKLIEHIISDFTEHEYLFSTREDTDVYKWVEELACYSPIIHMQQTDGISSSHAAFTPENNEKGIIKGRQLLQSIKKSYEMNAEKPLQEMTDELYLSFEIFSSNIETKKEILTKLKKSIEYWREFVPEDGATVDSLV